MGEGGHDLEKTAKCKRTQLGAGPWVWSCLCCCYSTSSLGLLPHLSRQKVDWIFPPVLSITKILTGS